MRLRLAVVATLCLSVSGFISSEAWAERISANGPDRKAAFSSCNASGGKTIAQFNGEHQVTSCITKDGHGVVCGGKTAEQQKTCDTFRQAGDQIRQRAGKHARPAAAR